MTVAMTGSRTSGRKPAFASSALPATSTPQLGDTSPADVVLEPDLLPPALLSVFPNHPATRHAVHHRLRVLVHGWIASECLSVVERYLSGMSEAVRASIVPSDTTQAALAQEILSGLHPAALIQLLSLDIDAERDVLLIHARSDAEPMARESSLDVLSGAADTSIVLQRVRTGCLTLLGPGLALLGADLTTHQHGDTGTGSVVSGKEALFVAALRQNNTDAAIRMLALHAKVDQARVAEAVWTRDARSLIGLAWRSGYSMRAAMLLQTQLAGIPRPSIMRPTDDGAGPMGRGEMAWQLAMLVTG